MVTAIGEMVRKWFGKGDDADSKNMEGSPPAGVGHDRLILSPETLDALRKDLIEVMSRYSRS